MIIIPRLLSLSLLIGTTHFTPAFAEPSAINYQGRFTNAAGIPQPGIKAMSLTIHDAPAGGTLLYSETIGNVTIDANGVYSFQFGASGAGTAASLGQALTASTEQWLELTVDGAAQTPRQKILAVPFALLAKGLPDGAVTSAMIADGAVGLSKVSGLGTAATADVEDFNPPNNLAAHKTATVANTFQKASIFMYGDSMIGTAIQRLRGATVARFGSCGVGLMDAGLSGGATIEQDACVKWITGQTFKLDSADDVVTFGSDVAWPVSGNTLKIYYLRQPGGGNFKVESETGAVWGAEPSYGNVSTDGPIAGQVITITKTNYKAAWRIRCTWVSGGTNGPVNIIGAGVRDTNSNGALLTSTYNGSNAVNNIDNAALTARAITDPIMADLAPTVMMISHLDGAERVNSSQAILQDNLIAGAISSGSPAPSWIVIGPPVGPTAQIDAANELQAVAQRTLAASRDDAFFDNRKWAGNVNEALSRGYLAPGNVHYLAKAQNVWIPAMYSQVDLGETAYASASSPTMLNFVGGGTISATPNAFNGLSEGLFMSGGLRLGYGQLILEDTAGPVSANDAGVISYTNDTLVFTPASISMFNYLGEYVITGAGATDGAPIGNAGIHAAPLKEVVTGAQSLGYVETSSNLTLGKTNYTVNVTSGSPTITLPLSAAAGTAGRNKGRIYVVRNTGAGIVQMATSTSARGNGVTNGTSTITFASNSVVPRPGERVTGIGIPTDTYVISATLSSATLSAASTDSNSGLTFVFSQAIDSSFPATVSSGGSLKVQSTGSGWITIP
jgi:hypothetical protein